MPLVCCCFHVEPTHALKIVPRIFKISLIERYPVTLLINLEVSFSQPISIYWKQCLCNVLYFGRLYQRDDVAFSVLVQLLTTQNATVQRIFPAPPNESSIGKTTVNCFPGFIALLQMFLIPTLFYFILDYAEDLIVASSSP